MIAAADSMIYSKNSSYYYCTKLFFSIILSSKGSHGENNLIQWREAFSICNIKFKGELFPAHRNINDKLVYFWCFSVQYHHVLTSTPQLLDLLNIKIKNKYIPHPVWGNNYFLYLLPNCNMVDFSGEKLDACGTWNILKAAVCKEMWIIRVLLIIFCHFGKFPQFLHQRLWTL